MTDDDTSYNIYVEEQTHLTFIDAQPNREEMIDAIATYRRAGSRPDETYFAVLTKDLDEGSKQANFEIFRLGCS